MKHVAATVRSQARTIWALHEDPEKLARGVAIGALVGSFPIIGQMPLAAALAVLLRGAVIPATILVHHSNPFTWPFYAAAGYWLGELLRGHDPTALPALPHDLAGFVALGGSAYLSIWLGLIIYGLFLTPVAYFGTHVLVRRYARKTGQRLVADVAVDLETTPGAPRTSGDVTPGNGAAAGGSAG